MKRSTLRKSAFVVAIAYMLCVIIVLLMMTSCACTKSTTNVSWYNSIKNPENAEYVYEVAFNENITLEEVTQEMFNKRYDIKE